jgi:hypothetical protein
MFAAFDIEAKGAIIDAFIEWLEHDHHTIHCLSPLVPLPSSTVAISSGIVSPVGTDGNTDDTAIGASPSCTPSGIAA